MPEPMGGPAPPASNALRPVRHEDVELEGPYECPSCGGHMMLDATFLDQVTTAVSCPYCRADVRADDVA